MKDARNFILEYIHQHDNPVTTRKLVNALLESEYSRQESWQALESLEQEGHISLLGGKWFLTASGMELMGWMV